MNNINPVLIITAIVLVIVLAGTIVGFIKLPNEKKIENLKEWLKWAVVIAEKELGSGTGQLKLREVYNMAVAQFPWIVSFITFEIFSQYVDEALEWMKQQLESNGAIATYINE